MENVLPFSDLDRIQTCNLLSRNQMRYSVAPRGLLLLRVQRYNFFLNLQEFFQKYFLFSQSTI